MSQNDAFLAALVIAIVLAWIAIEVLGRAARWARHAIDDRAVRREEREGDRR